MVAAISRTTHVRLHSHISREVSYKISHDVNKQKSAEMYP